MACAALLDHACYNPHMTAALFTIKIGLTDHATSAPQALSLCGCMRSLRASASDCNLPELHW